MEELFWKAFLTFQRQGNVTLLSEGTLIWTGLCIILDLNCVTLTSLLSCCPVLDHVLWCHFCPNIWASKKLTRNRVNVSKCNARCPPPEKKTSIWAHFSCGVTVPMSYDHKPCQLKEKKRIQVIEIFFQLLFLTTHIIFNHTYWFRNSIIFMTFMQEAGGFVAMNGVWRVQGVLATSRALGDYPLKVWSW